MRPLYEHATPEQRKLGARYFRPSDGALLNASYFVITPVRAVVIDVEVLDDEKTEAFQEWETRLAR